MFLAQPGWCGRTSSWCGRTNREIFFRKSLVRAHQTLLFFSQKNFGGFGAGAPKFFFRKFSIGAGAPCGSAGAPNLLFFLKKISEDLVRKFFFRKFSTGAGHLVEVREHQTFCFFWKKRVRSRCGRTYKMCGRTYMMCGRTSTRCESTKVFSFFLKNGYKISCGRTKFFF